MKIYDCFSYWDEDLLLELRLNILDKIVDHFVIVEGNKTWQNNPKELKFDIKKFQRFENKIIYIPVSDLPDGEDPYLRENHQRNSISRGIKNAKDDDIILISDLDEIPNPKKIKEFDIKNKYACFIQKNFHQKMNLLNVTIKEWPGTKICQKRYLKSPQWLRNIKIKERPFWKFYKPQKPQIILDGGWHFNNLKKPEELSKKFKSGAHQEENIEEFTNLDKINQRIKEKKDLFGRDYEYKSIKVDENYPEYILNNKNKFKEWIL